MLRAMDSAVAGLRAHQNKLDVISHNIANVNTFGFKSQTYSFKEAMYQTSTASTKSNNTQYGGVNASQYGYGSLTGSIATDMTASTPTYFGGINCTINGQGFFLTKSTGTPPDGIDSDSIKNAGFLFTRVGQFSVNAEGYVVDANGNFVFGFREKDPSVSDDVKTDELVALRVPSAASGTAATVFQGKALLAKNILVTNAGELQATVEVPGTDANGNATKDEKIVYLGKIAIANFQNQEGLTKMGENYYTTSQSDNTGDCTVNEPGSAGTAQLMTGYLEVSNVDLAKEFSDMITTQRGFQANCKIITVSDEVLQELVNMKR